MGQSLHGWVILKVQGDCIEAHLTLPVAAKLDLSTDVMEGFLPYTEHPPDAPRGWDLPPTFR